MEFLWLTQTHTVSGRTGNKTKDWIVDYLRPSQLWCLCVWCTHTQSCLTLCNPMDCSPPGSSVHGTVQARKLEWVAIPFSRGSSRPRGRTCVSWVSCIDRLILYHWATWEALWCLLVYEISLPELTNLFPLCCLWLLVIGPLQNLIIFSFVMEHFWSIQKD